MAFVNLVDQDLGLSLVHAVAVVNGWPLPKHDPALDVKLDEKDDIPDPAKIKSAKKRQEAEKRKAEREAALRLMEEKRAIEAKTQAEIKKNAVYVKLLGLADAKSYEELWAACLAASPKMQQLSEAEYDLVYSLALALWTGAKNQASYVNKFVASVLSSKKYPVAALKILFILFNALNADPRSTPASLRYSLFTQILKFALETDNAKLLDGQFKHVDTWAKEWKLDTNDTANVLRLVSEVLEAAGQSAESQSYILKYLTALEKADKKTLESAKDAAYSAVVFALGSNTVYQFDTLLALPAVKALQGDAKYNAAYTLLSIFTTQSVEAYIKFTAENKDFVSKARLNGDNLLRKIRTLTLCSLGLEKERLSFATLQQKLQLADANAVEASVLDAVVSQCIEAKIDEANEEVVILRTTRRNFDSTGWKALASQLADWKKNVSGVLATLHQIQNRAPAQASQDHKS